jgi:hypothetical protein
VTTTLGGTTNYLAKFTTPTNVENSSLLYDSGTAVGIGTTAPAATFHVVSTSTAAGIVDVYSNALTGVTFSTRAARGTPAAPAVVQAGDIIGGFTGKGWTGSGGFSGGRGALIIHANETWSATAQSTYMQFNTTALGTAAQAERMRIDNAGNVGIGTTNPGAPLEVNGSVKLTANSGGGVTFQDGTTQTTAFTGTGANGGVTSFNGRTGAVMPATGDYLFSQINGMATDTQIAGLSASKLTGAVLPANGGTGLTAVPSSGQYLRGTGTGWQASAIQTGDVPSLSGSYVDLTSTQSNIGGNKTFTSPVTINTSALTELSVTGGSTNGIYVSNAGNGVIVYGTSLGVSANASTSGGTGVVASGTIGVSATGNSTNGTGVSASGWMAVQGTSSASSGYGVSGSASGANGYGVYGSASGSGGTGTYGYSASGPGLYAQSATGTGGVFNVTSTSAKILSGQYKGTENFNIDASGNVATAGAVMTTLANSATGTTNAYLAKLAGGFAVQLGTGDSTGILGVVVSGGNTTGSAQIAVGGQASCNFDGGTTAGDYVQASASTGGACHDAGAAYPTTGQVLGRVLSTNAAAGTYGVYLFGAEQRASASGFSGVLVGDVTGTQGATSVVKVNGGAIPASAALVGTTSGGQFVAQTGTISNNTTGNAGGFTGVLSGDVTGIQTGTQVNATHLLSPLPIIQGGTGAGTPTGARANLGAAASGVNSDITSLTGLISPVTITTSGSGIAGLNVTNNSGSGIGVMGTANGPNAVAVYGSSTGSNSYGLSGYTNNSSSYTLALRADAGGLVTAQGTVGSPVFTVDGSGNVTTAGAVLTWVGNSNSTGTTNTYLAKLTTGGLVKLNPGDSTGIMGVVVAGGGISGTSDNAQVAVAGQAQCTFDGSAQVGDYVQASATMAGACHDAGITYPTTGQVLGRVLSTNYTAGDTAGVYLFGTEQRANTTNATNFSGSLAGDVTGTQTATSVVQVNGSAIPTSAAIVGTNSSGQFVAQTGTLTLSGGTTGLNATGSNYGVSGSASNSSGTTYGLYGTAASSSGYGVYGSNNSFSGIGIYGTGSGIGVYGNNTNSSGYGVSGNGATGVYGSGITGVYGNGTGTGVYGSASNSTGTTYGLYGTAASNSGYGVYGSNSSLNGIGIYGSGSAIGVYGNNTNSAGYGVSGNGATGVYGSGFTGVYGNGTGTGVYGSASISSGTAGVFNNTAGGKILSGQNNGAEKFSVDGSGDITAAGGANFSGNVGVGTTTPGYLLSVGSSSNSSKAVFESTDNNHGTVQIGNPTSNGEASIAFISGLMGFGDTPTSTNGSANIWGMGAGIWGIGGNKFGIGSDSYGGSMFTIESNGNVGVGIAGPATKLQVVGDIRVGTSGTNGCLQNFAGTALTGSCSSDARLKTNITPFAPVLSKVVQLQPVHYHWRSQEFPDYHFGDALNSGLIAQEVEKVFPEMVSVDAHGYKTVNYSELPYLLLGAVRELKAENDALQAKLSTESDRLKAENDILQARQAKFSAQAEQLKAENDALQLRLGAQSELMRAIEARLAQLEQKQVNEARTVGVITDKSQ